MFASSRCAAPAATPVPRPARPLAVWTVVTATVLAVVAAVVPEVVRSADLLRGPGSAPTFSDVLVGGCATAALAAAGWLWVVTTDVVVRVLAGTGRQRRRVGPVRALLLTACGVAVLGAATPAAAAVPPGPTTAVADPDGGAGRPPGDRRVLQGLPLPDRAVGAAAPREPAGAHPAARREVVTVRPGDSLWTIAADRLGPAAAVADVASYWLRVHALNADLIGPDPDLIHPGQRLRLPPLT